VEVREFTEVIDLVATNPRQWILPRHEGNHVLLLDVSDIADSSLADASSSGKTDFVLHLASGASKGSALRFVCR